MIKSAMVPKMTMAHVMSRQIEYGGGAIIPVDYALNSDRVALEKLTSTQEYQSTLNWLHEMATEPTRRAVLRLSLDTATRELIKVVELVSQRGIKWIWG